MSARLQDATDPTVSAWVSANAGSGKTHLLADRVTRLLLGGADPARILCLTYTKAAAAEMSSRLFDRLGGWALLPENELQEQLGKIGATSLDAETVRHARQLFAQALETPGGLKIQTIHAFCQNVLARFPVEAGITARFTVLDERSARELMRAARNAILERAVAGDAKLAPAVAILATRAPDSRFADILNLVIGDSGRLRALLEQHGDEARFFAHLRQTLNIAEGEDEDSIVSRFCEELGGEREQCRRIAEWLLNGSANDRKAGQRFADFTATMNPENFHHLRAVFVTEKHQPRANAVTKKAADARPDLFAYLTQLGARVLAAEEWRKRTATYTLTEALITTALAVLDEYQARKRARAALDYDDLVLRTQALLEREEAAQWVLYKLDGGLDHILVDEAQDTSPTQWKIVVKLAEEFFSGSGAYERAKPRTLFAVGDEKQSIFGFMGADPEQFGRHLVHFKSRAEDAKLAFADVRPLVSRRSAKTILSYVDEVFADAATREGLTSIDLPILHEPHRKEIGRVEIWPTVKPPPAPEHDAWDKPVDAPSPTGAHVALAARIARRIAYWLQTGTTLPGTQTPISPGDIMILVRRRNIFAQEMIRQLLEHGVPVAGADRMVLLDQIAITDLLALGRFVLLPEDDLNLAALLKSPIIGFDEDALFALAQPRAGRMWDELKKRNQEDPVFAAAHEFLNDRLREADYLPPFEFYARSLSRGLRRKILARLGDEAADAIDEFLALALAYESSHPPSLEGFLDWLVHGASEVRRDMEKGGGAVRVMTVHGAKGLEAHIVIVPDTAQTPAHEERAGILYTDESAFFGVPKAMETQPVRDAKDAAHAREMREYRRLLYVALTRARDWLIVCGYETAKGVQANSWYPALEAAARRIGRSEEDEFGETILAAGLALGGTAASAKAKAANTKLPEYLSRAPAQEPAAPRILRPSDAAGEDEPAMLSPVSDRNAKRFQRGLLIHALLAALPDLLPEARENAARNYLAQRGVAEDEMPALIRETLAVLDHPVFAPLFAGGSRGEIAIMAELPELGAGVRVSGQVDRLAVTADAVMVADFKTNRPPPETAQQTPALYRAQMALYRAALAKMYPGKRITCALVWTDGARLMALPDSLLDAEIAKIRARQIT